MSALHEFGRSRSGHKIDRGFYAVDPAGHLVLLPTSAPLKAGWRLATEGDIHAKQRAAIAHVEPLHVLDPIEDGVSEIDAIED